MQRISPVDVENTSAQVSELLLVVKRDMGGIPNIIATLARSSTALNAYLGFSGALDNGKLNPLLREQIALVTANSNGCDYCASAHSMLAKNAGINQAEIDLNMQGRSSDFITKQVLSFVSAVLRSNGNVTDAELNVIRKTGFNDEQITEIIAHVALNIFTNYFNNVANTTIDFPVVRTQQRTI